jgi:hypothetical protein
MDNKYLFFFSHDLQITWYSVFATAFKEIGPECKTVLFVHGEEDVAAAKSRGCYDIVVDMIAGFNYNAELPLGEVSVHPEIIALEKESKTLFFWDDIKADRWARAKNDPSFMVQYMNYAVSNILKTYRELNPIAAFGEYTMAIYRFAYRLFESKQKVMLYPITTRYFQRLYFETNIYWEWEKCLALYHEYVKSGVPENLKREVFPIYENIAVKFSRPNYTLYQNNFSVGYTQINKLSINQIYKKVKRSFQKIDENVFRNNVRYSTMENSIFSKFKRILQERESHRIYEKSIVDEMPKGIKYALYFLHFQPEYTVDGLGKFYMDQQFLIKNIASALPADTYLVVKEHPTMIGLRDSRLYAHVKSISNVIFIKHTFDSVTLIKGASLIFTIVGTAALEAMFIGKPAIMFGRYAFANTNTISLCTDIWQLEKMVRDKLNITYSKEEIERHSLALFAAKFQASKPGQIPIAAELIEPFINDAQQTTLIKQSFKDELKERELV